MQNAVADRVWLARDLLRRSGPPPAFRSVTAEGGVALSDVSDVVTAVADIPGLLDELIPAVFWCENGHGNGLPGGIVCQNGEVEFLLFDMIRVPLRGGITPEILVRLLASELGYSRETVISVTLFFSFGCQPPEQLLGQLDGGFTVRVMSERRLRWPRIFPREYYRDDQNRPRDRCRPWAMGAGTPVKVSGPEPLVGCNFFLRRCQH